jgi:hypothetical protein
MLGEFFSPLAPAAVLLLGAFILPLAALQLPARWRAQPWLRQFGAPSLVGLAALALLGVRLTFGADISGEGLELLSGWDFAAAETIAALTVRADALSLPFLMLTMLILLAVTLATPLNFPVPGRNEENVSDLSIWLALGAGACFLFVSANGLTLVYALVGFDVLTMFYWLQRGQRDMSIARIFLGLFTAVGLSLASLAITAGAFWLGLALWLRLGLYPFIEATLHTRWQDYGGLTYLGLSLMVGIYLVTRVVVTPLSALILWLTVILMVLNGLLAWLADQTPLKLTRLLLVEASLILLVAPVQPDVATAYVMGLILSLVVLWVTPRLGRPRLGERSWLWPYLPAVAATLTLIGLPFSLGWLARKNIYETLLFLDDTMILWGVLLAEIMVLSGLVSYWFSLWQGDEVNERQSMVGIMVMVPFLIPGLALFILSVITKTKLPPADFEQPLGVLIAQLTTIVGAIGLGFFRQPLIRRVGISPATLIDLVSLHWLLRWLEMTLGGVSRLVLWVRAVLEGQHYIGWALFTALVGILIILLGT